MNRATLKAPSTGHAVMPPRNRDIWLTPAEAAGRIGYPDGAALGAFLAARGGYARDGVPTGRALALGVARPVGDGWLWLEDFVTLLARASGMVGADAFCAVETPECAGQALRAALDRICLRRAPWKDGPAWRAFMESPDADRVARLRHAPWLAGRVAEVGPEAVLDETGPVLSRLLAACDPTDPETAVAAAAFRAALDTIAAIGTEHPLVRYGIVAAPAERALAA